ncbi:VOC family protein [Microbacterium hydrocarbonoxydans]|uniref:VOC family protein n=1 Tax=Microbacterium hydrocarbonoxydans TaxID=273678 RepID=UPI0007BAECEE|nr:VOC family protein [Microbacterium hydrocarbonoxydans]GAT72382.1 glyoxalase/bleomycin resistance protein /dioxygenase [Microbacterium sp. HM58-2]
MTGTGLISSLGYVSMRTTDLDAVIRNATDILGLHEVETTRQKSFLSAQANHHEIVYSRSDENSVDHIGLVAQTRQAFEQIRENVARGGYRIVSEQPIEDHIDEGFAVVGPEGFTWQVYLERSAYSMVKLGGFGPDRFGHVNVQVVDALAMRDFLVDVFGFRVSDQIGDDAAFFLRCNNDHHGVAVFKSTRAAMHHHAWQTQSIVDLGRLGDRLARTGSRLAWGPVRHGAGDNIAVYYVEPTGAVIELYTDLELIFDPERQIRHWQEDDLYWINQWDGQVPDGILDHGVPPTAR